MIKPASPLQFTDTLSLWTTADSLARELYPNVTYDTALPQPWVDEVYSLTGISPAHFPAKCIWAYPKGYNFGAPLPLTREANELLKSIGESHV